VNTPEDTPIDITLSGSDADGDALTYTLVGMPAHGSVTLVDNVVTYAPDIDFFGEDTFTFTVSDGEFTSEAATVAITVIPVNDAPVADDQQVSTPEETPVDITLTGSDIEDDALTFALLELPAHGTVNLSGNVVTYTPDENYFGADLFTFTVSDGELTSDEGIVSIDVVEEEDDNSGGDGNGGGDSDDGGSGSDDSIVVFELITPNQDGRNDFLFIQNVEKTQRNSLKIYNRWGVSVYEGENYNNQNRIFDGRSRNKTSLNASDYLPSGVYFYVFEYEMNQQTKVIRGFLYLGSK
jgi:gliding motility-associated-like protein